MCLCILGIAIFITLIVDINKYISMMKTYWQKGGKQLWNQRENSLAITKKFGHDKLSSIYMFLIF